MLLLFLINMKCLFGCTFREIKQLCTVEHRKCSRLSNTTSNLKKKWTERKRRLQKNAIKNKSLFFTCASALFALVLFFYLRIRYVFTMRKRCRMDLSKHTNRLYNRSIYLRRHCRQEISVSIVNWTAKIVGEPMSRRYK